LVPAAREAPSILQDERPIKIEMHCHTRYGSSCSYMMPEELVQQAVKVGLDGVCITEHDVPWDRDAALRLSDRFGILVVGGMEVSTALGEVLVWGLHDPILDVKDVQDLRRRVDQAGGVMVAAHPFRGAQSLVRWDPSRGLVFRVEQAVRLPVFRVVDAMEVFNGMAPDWELDLTAAAAEALSMGGTGGSDAHNVDSVGQCYTVLHRRVSSEEELLEEMRTGRFHAEHGLLRRRYPQLEAVSAQEAVAHAR
jgi:predicted metal-dependent phosphoesterase TrpH